MNVAELTRDLVSIPSHDDETEAGDFIESWLREHTDSAVYRDNHGNVFARKGRDIDPDDDSLARDGASGPSLALAGHHDVVPPDEDQIEDGEYVVEERDGRLYGRGTADMKGCVAAAMLAFEAADDPDCELVFVSFVAEESGCLGSTAAVEDGFAPDDVVVGEGSTNYSGDDVTDVAVAHKGRRGSTIRASGTAAHASEGAAGENAIYRATDAVDIVRDLSVPETTVMGHRVGGSVAVTEIEGGTAWNVIPDACTVTVDERTVPGERAPLERVEEIPGVKWEIDQDLPPMACGDDAFARMVLDVAGGVQDGTPAHVVKPHATDAGNLSGAGTECVVVGAAESGEAHTADESVSIAVLERCERLYRGIADRFDGA
jgi:acetylornithine deacetylase